MLRLLLLVSCLLALAASCGGGKDLTDRDITGADLVAMVLLQEDFGSKYGQFQFDEDSSGFSSNDEHIENSFDQEDAEEDVERFGRVTAYREGYSPPTGPSGDSGVTFIRSEVALYEDADGASGDLTDTVEDTKDLQGMTDEGLTLEDVDEFEPDDIGDESVGLILTVSTSDNGEEEFFSIIAFRRGRLIGAVLIVQFGREDPREELGELAGKLDERIQAVLEGEIEPRGTPSPVPTPTSTPTTTPQPTTEAGSQGAGVCTQVGAAGELEILSTSQYTSSIDTLNIVGELRNNTSSNYQFVEVTGIFYDSADAFLTTELTFAQTDIITPDAKSGFTLLVFDVAQLDITRCELQVEGDVTNRQPAPGLVISDVSTNVDIIDAFRVEGLVTNESENTYDFVEVIGTFYDGEGRVVAAEFGFTVADELAPGATSPFEILIIDGGSLGIDDFVLDAQGSIF